MRPQPRSRVIALVVCAMASLFAVGLLGPPSAAQAPAPSDPYGSTTVTTAPPTDPTCSMDDLTLTVGATVSGSIAGAEAGAEVAIVLGGDTVTDVVTDASGAADFSFVVPPLDEGTHSLVAVGVTFTVSCGDGQGVEVLGEGTQNDGDGATNGSGSGSGSGATGAGAGSGSSGGGSLARTGATLLPLVVLAAVLLLVGRTLRRRSRERRALAV